MNLRQIVCIALFCSAALFTAAQQDATHVYSQSTKCNLLLSGASFSTSLGGFILERTVSGYSEDFISNLSRPTSLNSIDQLSLDWHDLGYKKMSDGFLLGSAAVPSLLFSSPKTRGHRKQLVFEWSQVSTLTVGLTSLTKVIVKRNRPFLFNPSAPIGVKEEPDARYSFFSGHTSLTAASWFFLAHHVQRLGNNRWVKIGTWVLASTIPAFVGYARMRAGEHYFSDVATGYVVGASIGYFIPLLHQRSISKRASKKR